MSYELETVSLTTQSNLHDLIRILTGAFRYDPLLEYLFPGNASRLEELNTFFRVNLEFGLAAGEIYCTTSMLGCAVWLFPGDRSRTRVSRTGLPAERFKLLLDSESYRKYADFEEYMKEVHIGLQCPSYCLLLFLGVEERQRARGVGSRLMQPVLKTADEKGMPCILDTMNESNLEFYRMHNFKVCREYHICRTGPYGWTMIRRPQ